MPFTPTPIPDFTHRLPRRTAAEMAARNRTLVAFDEASAEPIARIRFWNQEIVLVNDAALIHGVLVEQSDAFHKGPLLTRNARPLLGNGLLTSDNALNRRQRRILSPAFAHRKVGEYAEIVPRQTQHRVEMWADQSTIDVPQEMLAITLAVIGDLLFGTDVEQSAPVVGWAIPVLMNFAIDQLRAPWRAVVGVPEALHALFALNQTVNRQIANRRASGAVQDNDERALLDQLLWGADGLPQMTARLVRDEAMTIFLAGLETVALAVAWALYLLTTHPEAYDRVRAEADALGGDPTVTDLPRLPFTSQVFKEAMRLYPPVYIVARQAIESVDIGPYRLPRGTVVFVSAYVRHRRPELFTDPLRFDPDRWSLPEFERRLPRYAYLPFGGGPHVCIGGHFAMLEGHLMLATLARRVAFSTIPGEPEVRPEPLFTLRPREPLRMRVHLR